MFLKSWWVGLSSSLPFVSPLAAGSGAQPLQPASNLAVIWLSTSEVTFWNMWRFHVWNPSVVCCLQLCISYSVKSNIYFSITMTFMGLLDPCNHCSYHSFLSFTRPIEMACGHVYIWMSLFSKEMGFWLTTCYSTPAAISFFSSHFYFFFSECDKKKAKKFTHCTLLTSTPRQLFLWKQWYVWLQRDLTAGLSCSQNVSDTSTDCGYLEHNINPSPCAWETVSSCHRGRCWSKNIIVTVV